MNTSRTAMLNANISALIAFFNIAVKILPSDLPDINRSCDYRTLSRLSARLCIMEGRCRHLSKNAYPHETSMTLRRLIVNVLIFLDEPESEVKSAEGDNEESPDNFHPFLGA